MSDAAEKLEAMGVRMDLEHGESKARPPGMDASMNGYTVHLHYNGRSLTTDFFTGSGWTHDPNVADVVSSLVSDAASDYMTFEDFASDFGYDLDSRKARATWRAVKQSGAKTRKLFGPDFEKVVELVADY